LSHRYEFSLRIEGERGVLWTNRRFVAFRPRGSRWFRPMRSDKVPKGDERPYPQGGTTSLLNSLRDAVLTGKSARLAATTTSGPWPWSRPAKCQIGNVAPFRLSEVYAPAVAGKAG